MANVTEPAAPATPQSTPGVASTGPQSLTREEAARLAHAKRRVAAIKGFYIHLLVFALVLGGLFGINAATGGSWWVQWVLLGWGIGVVAHALAVFGRAPRAVAEWEERKVKQLANEQ